MAVWTNSLEIFFSIVRAIAINVIDFKWTFSTLRIDFIPTTFNALEIGFL
jgi:hypothetical protein